MEAWQFDAKALRHFREPLITFYSSLTLLSVQLDQMDLEYDPEKRQATLDARKIDFEDARHFDFDSALVKEDDRKDYGETRWVALGYLHGRLHVLCFLEAEKGIRVISFRKANDREVRRYDAFKAQSAE